MTTKISTPPLRWVSDGIGDDSETHTAVIVDAKSRYPIGARRPIGGGGIGARYHLCETEMDRWLVMLIVPDSNPKNDEWDIRLGYGGSLREAKQFAEEHYRGVGRFAKAAE